MIRQIIEYIHDNIWDFIFILIICVIVFILFSCSTITEKSSSAELSIIEAEKIVEKLPDSSDKVLIRIALNQSKKELSQNHEIIQSLSKENKSNEKKIVNLSESTGKYEGLRNIALWIGGLVVAIGLGILVFKLAPAIIDKVPKI